MVSACVMAVGKGRDVGHTSVDPVGDVAARLVSEFYDAFPQRYARGMQEIPEVDLAPISVLIREASYSFDGLRVLDAGCGTGAQATSLARQNPLTTVVGFDCSAKSIAVARQSQLLAGLNNVAFSVSSCEAFSSEDPFDLVWCNGVLHHIGMPAKALGALHKCLTAKGVAAIWVLHRYGHRDIMLKRELVQRLSYSEAGDWKTQVRWLDELNLSIPADRYGHNQLGEDTESVAQTRKADAFLTPYLCPWTFADALAHAKQAGFSWLAIDQVTTEKGTRLLALTSEDDAPPWVTSLTEVFPSALVRRRLGELPIAERLACIELEMRPRGFLFLAGSEDSFAQCSPRIRANTCRLL